MSKTATAAVPTPAARLPFKVKDLALAELGRKEIRLAEQEMPGLMALRATVRGAEAARGRAHHGVAPHDGADGGPDRDARRPRRRRALGVVQHLQHAGHGRRRGRRRAHGHRAASPQGIAVFAWKGETLEEYWWCTNEALVWPDGGGPDLIVDDGGDATLLVHKGPRVRARRPRARRSTRRAIPRSGASSWRCVRRLQREAPGQWQRISPKVRGVSEETTTGVHRLYEMAKKGALLFPAINVNDSVTKSKFDNIYGCRHSLDRRAEPRHRRHARRQDRRRVRLRRGRQGLRGVAPRPGLPRDRDRDRSHLRAPGRDAGLRGRDGRRLRRQGRRLRHDDRQRRASSPPSTWRG